MGKMILSGDENLPDMPLKESEVNHLRRLLAWMRCEYLADDAYAIGMLDAADKMVRLGVTTPEKAQDSLEHFAGVMNRCPKYVRQSITMLTQALREHEKRAGVVDA